MKPVKAWAICNRRGLAPLKYITGCRLQVDERVLPIWRTKADAESWRSSDEHEWVVPVEIREVAKKGERPWKMTASLDSTTSP
jgi:hypothetical protein